MASSWGRARCDRRAGSAPAVTFRRLPRYATSMRRSCMSSTLHRRFTVPLVILATSGLVLSGCSADGGGGSSGTGPGDAGEADGVVTMYGTIIDTEEDLLNESWARPRSASAPRVATPRTSRSSPSRACSRTSRPAITSSRHPRVSPTTLPSTGQMTGLATPPPVTFCTAPR
jgi:hypothetical protein